MGGFIVLQDGRAFAVRNLIVDEMLRAIAAELPAGRLHDWLLAQQSDAPGQWEAHVEVRELDARQRRQIEFVLRTSV